MSSILPAPAELPSVFGGCHLEQGNLGDMGTCGAARGRTPHVYCLSPVCKGLLRATGDDEVESVVSSPPSRAGGRARAGGTLNVAAVTGLSQPRLASRWCPPVPGGGVPPCPALGFATPSRAPVFPHVFLTCDGDVTTGRH